MDCRGLEFIEFKPDVSESQLLVILCADEDTPGWMGSQGYWVNHHLLWHWPFRGWVVWLRWEEGWGSQHQRNHLDRWPLSEDLLDGDDCQRAESMKLRWNLIMYFIVLLLVSVDELNLGSCGGNEGTEHVENGRYANDETMSHKQNWIPLFPSS